MGQGPDSTRPHNWQANATELQKQARWLIQAGRARDAFDLASEGIVQLGERPALRQVQALALCQTGAPRAATEMLQELLRQGAQDTETLSLLGRAAKDLARAARTPAETRTYQTEALQWYRRAFDQHQDPYPGINAAALALICGDSATARTIARQVAALCEHGPPADTMSAYWAQATRAEALLILGDLTGARQAYQSALAVAGTPIYSRRATARQAQEILTAAGLPETTLAGLFAAPALLAWQPGAGTDPNPAPVPDIAWCVPLEPAALRFAEQMIAQGSELRLVLPVEAGPLTEALNLLPDGPVHGQRLARVLKRAASVNVCSDGTDLSLPLLVPYAEACMLGAMLLEAREFGAQPAILTPGGLQPIGGSATPASPWVARLRALCHQPGEVPGIKGILFADVIGYSRLTEQEIVHYYDSLLPRVAHICAGLRPVPDLRSTWGDGFYFVMGSLPAAAELALRLRDLFETTDWRQLGFRDQLAVRIGLHAGPLQLLRDAVTGRVNFTGRHTTRTARLEPIADEGQIFVSSAFAALMALAAPGEHEFVYAGARPFSKAYGEERIYILRPSVDTTPALERSP